LTLYSKYDIVGKHFGAHIERTNEADPRHEDDIVESTNV